MSRWRAAGAGLVVWVGAAACGSPVDVVAEARPCARDRDCDPGQRCITGACSTPGGGVDAAFCAGSGALVPTGDGRCRDGSLDHLQAICLCGDLVVNRGAVVDTLGVNGTVDVAGALTAGTTQVASPRGLRAGPGLDVTGDLLVGGPVSVGGSAAIAGDALIDGRLRVGGDLSVDGRVRTPDGASDLDVTGNVTVGEQVAGPVDVPSPCRCGDPEITTALPEAALAAFEGAARSTPSELDGRTGEVGLSCGRYAEARIVAPGDLTLAASGRVALLVEGDTVVEGRLTLALAGDDAELDLVILGSLTVAGDVIGGDPRRPEALRIVLAAPDPVFNVAGSVDLAGIVHAPTATAAFGGELDGQGAWFVDRLDVSASLGLSGTEPCVP